MSVSFCFATNDVISGDILMIFSLIILISYLVCKGKPHAQPRLQVSATRLQLLAISNGRAQWDRCDREWG